MKPIWIDINRQFGAPCINGFGIQTRIIAERFTCGESVSVLAHDYRLARKHVEDAIRYELATPKQKREMVQIDDEGPVECNGKTYKLMSNLQWKELV